MIKGGDIFGRLLDAAVMVVLLLRWVRRDAPRAARRTEAKRRGEAHSSFMAMTGHEYRKVGDYAGGHPCLPIPRHEWVKKEK